MSWVVSYHNLICYASYNINAAIVTYHGNLKTTLRQLTDSTMEKE